jgi:NAD(P)-dependent dehydrogenase (short-subunit alcohol dehydrogenase family)
MIVITGGNVGIGFEVAKRLLSKGLSVCLGLKTAEKCELTRAKLSHFAVQNARLELNLLDLSDKKSVLAFAKTISQKDWKIDVLVHNGAAFLTTQQCQNILE